MLRLLCIAVAVPEHITPDVIDAKGDVVMPNNQPNDLVNREAFRARQARARRGPLGNAATGGARAVPSAPEELQGAAANAAANVQAAGDAAAAQP